MKQRQPDMGTRGQGERVWRLLLVPLSPCLLVLFLSTVCAAQTTREGLDTLNDDALMNELGSRGLDSLLERAFEVNKVPESDRQGRRTLLALARLSDPNTKLSAIQRQQLVGEIVQGIEKALPT